MSTDTITSWPPRCPCCEREMEVKEVRYEPPTTVMYKPHHMSFELGRRVPTGAPNKPTQATPPTTTVVFECVWGCI